MLVLLVIGLASCNRDFYTQTPPFIYKKKTICPANEPIAWWYRHGTGQNYNRRFKRHRFLF